MQRSTPLTRKTGPASCMRNFEGTVSRCFASSVCSKLPLKAKAHVVRKEGVESIRGGGVGGAPPPRTGCSMGKLPHSVPLCNTNIVNRPTKLEPGPQSDRFSLQTRRFSVGWGEDPNPVGRAVLGAGDEVAGRIAVRWAGPYPRAMSRARLLVLPCLLLIAVLLAACGGAGGAADADPAKAVPAGTAIYIEGGIRPEGDQRDDLMDAARKVLRTDDREAKLHELIDKGLKESDGPATSYDKDIAPWLGQKAAVWVAGVDRAKPGYVVLVAAKDKDKAQAAIDKGAKSEKGVKERSYKGVDYQVDGDGVAAGIVGDFVAIGTEPEFKRTVAAEDGDSLADEKRFKSAIDDLDDDRIGSFYVDLK